MPDEYDFKNYKTMEEYSRTLDGNKYLHSLYLKAVNHPIRRSILEIVNMEETIPKATLFELLKQKGVVQDKSSFEYNLDYLKKAFCIEIDTESEELLIKITQSGKVVEYLDK